MSITRRTTLRKAFLAPWHPLVPKVWLYGIARAQQQTGVAFHHGIAVVTHHHLCATSERDNLPLFVQQAHNEISRGLNALLAKERYDAPRELFDGRQAHYMRLLDAPAQASQLNYDYNNCVAAGLVSRPEHMPGHVFDFELWKRGYIDVDKPDIYFGEEAPDIIRMAVTPPPLLYEAFGGDLDRLVYHMQRLVEDTAGAVRAARKRSPLGARGVQRIHPWSEPRTLREKGGQRVPTFRIGARGMLGFRGHVESANEVRRFRSAHADARKARQAGDMTACFPYGTYQMRVLHRAPVATCPGIGTLVTEPGPLLCDVQARLEAERQANGPADRDRIRVETTALLGEVKDAFREEVAELCENAELVFKHDAPEPIDDETTRPTRATRHRFDGAGRHDPAQQAGPAGARRLVILRDRRRGRKPSRGRHGADPPA